MKKYRITFECEVEPGSMHLTSTGVDKAPEDVLKMITTHLVRHLQEPRSLFEVIMEFLGR